MQRLKNKTCVITGAARGIGRAAAEAFPALAVLLASDEAAYMTGAELIIDGGLLAGSAASPG